MLGVCGVCLTFQFFKVIAIELEVSLYCLTHSPPSAYIQTTLVVPKKKS